MLLLLLFVFSRLFHRYCGHVQLYELNFVSERKAIRKERLRCVKAELAKGARKEEVVCDAVRWRDQIRIVSDVGL